MQRPLLLIAMLGVAACGGGAGSGATHWEPTPRPLASIPQGLRFAPDPAFHGASTTLSTTACLTHLIDPATNTRLTLVHSVGGDAKAAAQSAGVKAKAAPQGDFSMEPPNQYGLRTGELLRVDCATGRPLGAVTK